ncbi:MAG: IclR family transcriptional regulator [Desulfofustis sp.]|nr:IclR family transcriptional regulator [Desulfofustis sp.]
MEKTSSASYTIPSVKKVDEILGYLAKHGDSTLTRIYVDLGLPKSSTYKLLKSLEALGYIRCQPASQTYLLGMKLLELGSKASEQIDITAIATPILKDLSQQVSRLCHLGVLDGDQVVYVIKTSTNELIRIGTWVGRRIGAHCTAMGKVLLAWKPPEEIERYLDEADLERMTPNTVVDKDRLRDMLAEVKRNGWSLDDEESTRMVRAVGAPVRDQSGEVCAGLSICTLTEIDSLVELLALKDTAIEAANQISAELGWRP